MWVGQTPVGVVTVAQGQILQESAKQKMGFV